MERSRLRRTLGSAGGAPGGAIAARGRPRTLERLQHFLRASLRLAPRAGGGKRDTPAARDNRPARRRCPQRLRERSDARTEESEPRLPGSLLTVPQPALASTASNRPSDRLEASRARLLVAGAPCRCAAAVGRLGLRPPAELRQLDRRTRTRRSRRP